MINFLFLKVLNMSITASVVILFVLAARFLLRRLPKIFSYLLWGIVIFRLICPFSFTVPFSLLDLTNPKSVENGEVIYISADTLYMEEPDAAGTVFNDGGEVLNLNNMKPLTEREQPVIPVVAYIWILGMFGIVCYSILSFVRLKRKLVGAVKCGENVWMSDYVSSSFVMGLFKPQIYLWSGLSKEEKGFVIAHEETHIRRCDHLIKLFFYLVLTMHWFNPMVWLSYFLCMKDMEMSCDESVMKKMGDGERADYSQTLLSLATGRKIFAGMPLFFGEGDTKSRIKNILNYKKPTMWAVAGGVIAVVILCVGFMGNPSEDLDVSEDNSVATGSSLSYPEYPVYVRTMGVGSVGCEYGYCAVSGRDDEEILAELSQMSGFYFSNYYSEDVALFYTDEPREIKLYHTYEGSTDYEEYVFAGEGYEYPDGAENVKYVIPLPKDYGTHYFFAVISWEDGSEDLMYFSMEYNYNPPSVVDYNKMQLMKNQTGKMEVKYPELYFPSYTMEAFTLRLTLPQGWFLEKRGLTATDITTLRSKEIIGTFLTTYVFNEDGICVGKMGCNYYDLYEGEEDNPQAIYNQVALGNHYQFDVRNSYEVICRSDVIETATADVLYMEPANDGGDTTANYGILSRSREGRVYVALEFESGLVSEEEVLAIAESISFEIRENSQSPSEENGGIPKE